MQVLIRFLPKNQSIFQKSGIIIQRELSSKASVEEYGKNNKYYYRQSPLSDKIEANKIPLALVLGWAGAIDKHVYKYAQMYEELGYHTIRLSPTARLSVFQPHLHKEYTIKLLDLIKSHKNLDNSPIVVHTFSNAGTFIYRHISELVRQDNQYSYLKPNLKAMILDSGPGFTDEYGRLLRSVSELVEHTVKIKPLAYSIAIAGLAAWFLKYKVPHKKQNFLDNTLEALRTDPFHLPTLVFCSKGDDLINYKQTLKFVENRKKYAPNLKIDTVIYEDSGHCMHYLKHRDAYLNKLKQHLADANLPLFENSQFK